MFRIYDFIVSYRYDIFINEDMNEQNFRDYLITMYKSTKESNPLYSIRAYAKFLGIGKTTLSDFLNNKRSLSEKMLAKVLDKLKISENEKSKFRFEILSENKVGKNEFTKEEYDLSKDEFELISDWYHLAILGLAQLPNHLATLEYLNSKLGVDKNKISDALERLQRLELIEIKKNKIIRTSKPVKFHSEIPSEAVRNYHLQNLELSKKAIAELKMEDRYMTAISVPSNRKKLKSVIKLIEKVKHQIGDSMTTTDPTDVFTVAIQVFPVTKS